MIIEALKYYYNVDHLKDVSTHGDLITNWGDKNIKKPTKKIIKEAINKYNKEVLIPETIKNIAKEKILSFAPEWKQINALRNGDTDGLFVRIEKIRKHSNFLESCIADGIDVDINSGWSE